MPQNELVTGKTSIFGGGFRPVANSWKSRGRRAGSGPFCRILPEGWRGGSSGQPMRLDRFVPGRTGRFMDKLRILVADDSPELAWTLAQLLRAWGHDVAVATDGAQAVEVATVAPFDAAVLDLEMPGMDGFAVAESLRGQPAHGSIRLVAVTGHGEDEWRRRAVAAGFDHFLAKPVISSQLKALLQLDPRAARDA